MVLVPLLCFCWDLFSEEFDDNGRIRRYTANRFFDLLGLVPNSVGSGGRSQDDGSSDFDVQNVFSTCFDFVGSSLSNDDARFFLRLNVELK